MSIPFGGNDYFSKVIQEALHAGATYVVPRTRKIWGISIAVGIYSYNWGLTYSPGILVAGAQHTATAYLPSFTPISVVKGINDAVAVLAPIWVPWASPELSYRGCIQLALGTSFVLNTVHKLFFETQTKQNTEEEERRKKEAEQLVQALYSRNLILPAHSFYMSGTFPTGTFPTGAIPSGPSMPNPFAHVVFPNEVVPSTSATTAQPATTASTTTSTATAPSTAASTTPSCAATTEKTEPKPPQSSTKASETKPAANETKETKSEDLFGDRPAPWWHLCC